MQYPEEQYRVQWEQWLALLDELADGGSPLLERSTPRHGQDRTPYVDALIEEALRQPTRGQAPGHMGQPVPGFSEMFPNYTHLDVSVMKGVDSPRIRGRKSPLQEAEDLCAELYGARACRFVTTGATHAAKAAARALFDTVGRDGGIAVQASCHISVIDALIALGARVVLLPPQVSELGFATVLDPDDLEQWLKGRPDIGAVVVSTPCYEGGVAKTRRLVDVVHAHGKVVMVDSSWGSELGLAPSLLPESALQAGADLVVGSPHKSMGAPGQAAWIFLSHGSRIDPVVFGAAVRTELSTSKSSVLLAGLDWTRYLATRYGGGRIWRSVTTVREEEDRLQDLDLGHLLVDWDAMGVSHIPYRPIIDVRSTGHDGYEVAAELLKLGIQYAQPNIGFVCLGFGIGADSQIRAFYRAVEEVVRALPERPPLGRIPLPPFELQEVDFSGVVGSGMEAVPLREAVGRMPACPGGGYPPGACIIVPGLRITEAQVAYLEEILPRGATWFGPPQEVPAGSILVIPE